MTTLTLLTKYIQQFPAYADHTVVDYEEINSMYAMKIIDPLGESAWEELDIVAYQTFIFNLLMSNK